MGYADAIEDNFNKDGITCSFVTITANGGSAGNAADILEETLEGGGIGGYYEVSQAEVNNLAVMLYNDLKAPEIKEYDPTPFQPKIDDVTGVVAGIEQADIPQLGGYYGTRLKRGALQPLITDYGDAPVYAQWDYGKGKVGSFMCDLQNSEWSSEFMADESGKRLIKNILNNLMPLENIEVKAVEMKLREENITNSLTITADLQEGQRITGEIVNIETGASVSMGTATSASGSADVFVTTPLNAENNYTRCYFGVRTPGVYSITARIVDAEGNVVENSENVIYKAFAYSDEYNLSQTEEEEIVADMTALAQIGGGSFIEDTDDPVEVIENFTIVFDREFDPRFLFLILIIIMFLMDIAVRKFKFKWPHELIREYRSKRNK